MFMNLKNLISTTDDDARRMDDAIMRAMAGAETDMKAKTMKDANTDDLLGEISARMEDKDETIAF